MSDLLRPVAVYLASRRWLAATAVRVATGGLAAGLPLQVPIPGAPAPVDLVATFPLVFALSSAVTLPSSLAWIGEGWRTRTSRLGALLVGDGVTIVVAAIFLDPVTAVAIVGSALLVEAISLGVALAHPRLAWASAALVGLTMTLETAWAPVPLFLAIPFGPAVAVWAAFAAVHVALPAKGFRSSPG